MRSFAILVVSASLTCIAASLSAQVLAPSYKLIPIEKVAPAPLAKPTSLSADHVGGTQINLKWIDNATQETGYAIERCAGVGCTNFQEVIRYPANTVSAIQTQLYPGATYSFRVKAFNATGSSVYSLVATEATSPPPSPPAGFHALALSTSEVDLTWTDGTTIAFHVERCAGTGCTSYVEIAAPGPMERSYHDSGLARSTWYQYRIRREAGTGMSGYAETFIRTPAAGAAPIAPVIASVKNVMSKAVDIKWVDKSTTEAGFDLEKCDGSACSDSGSGLLRKVAANVTQEQFGALTALQTYTFRVRARDSYGVFSAWSNNVTITMPAVSLPAAPTDFKAVTVTSTAVTLSWAYTSSVPVSTFKIFRCTASSCGDNANVVSAPPESMTATDTQVTPGASYIYRLQAVNIDGSSPWATDVRITIPVK